MPVGAHVQPHPNIVNQQQAQRNVHAEHQLAQRRSLKPNDRNMPDGLEEITIGDGVQQYKELREVERKLDYAMMRKRLEIGDSIHRMSKRHKTIRIWISNTAENQPWQERGLDADAFDFGTGVDGTYRVRIEGRVLDDDLDDPITNDDEEEDEESSDMKSMAETADKAQKPEPRKRLSHFFKGISIEFDKPTTVSPESAQIEWIKQPGGAEFDSLQFERKGDENTNVTINLTRAETPERFRLSKSLSDVLDTDEEDKSGAVLGIWDYVKAMGLQEDEEKRAVRCDDRLKAVSLSTLLRNHCLLFQVFGNDTVSFPHIPERLIPHLLPLDPIKLPYTIRVDPAYQTSPTPTIYDIRVTVDDPLQARMLAMTHNPAYPATLRQISQLDDQLAIIIQALAHSKAKHSFYKSMQGDPVNFVKRWMSSQKRDLEVILGEATRGGGEDGNAPEFQRGGSWGIWGTQAVKEAVRYKLAKDATPRR
jgi:SWI/SNF-related matrix-associated actin-dependent regulator of chromatin subfamily D